MKVEEILNSIHVDHELKASSSLDFTNSDINFLLGMVEAIEYLLGQVKCQAALDAMKAFQESIRKTSFGGLNGKLNALAALKDYVVGGKRAAEKVKGRLDLDPQTASSLELALNKIAIQDPENAKRAAVLSFLLEKVGSKFNSGSSGKSDTPDNLTAAAAACNRASKSITKKVSNFAETEVWKKYYCINIFDFTDHENPSSIVQALHIGFGYMGYPDVGNLLDGLKLDGTMGAEQLVQALADLTTSLGKVEVTQKNSKELESIVSLVAQLHRPLTDLGVQSEKLKSFFVSCNNIVEKAQAIERAKKSQSDAKESETKKDLDDEKEEEFFDVIEPEKYNAEEKEKNQPEIAKEISYLRRSLEKYKEAVDNELKNAFQSIQNINGNTNLDAVKKALIDSITKIQVKLEDQETVSSMLCERTLQSFNLRAYHHLPESLQKADIFIAALKAAGLEEKPSYNAVVRNDALRKSFGFSSVDNYKEWEIQCRAWFPESSAWFPIHHAMEKGAALLGWFGSFLPTLSAEPRIAESFSEAVEKRQDALEIEKECLVDQAQHRKLTIQLRSLQSIKSLHLFQKRQELKRKLTEFKTEYNKWYNKICRFIHKYLNKAKYELWEHDKETVDAVEEKLSKLDAKPVISERDVQDVKEQLENTLTRADNTGLKSYLRRSRVAFFVNPPPEEIRPQVQPRPDAAAGP